ncbi:MAG: hypothetical protein K2X81_16900, partial [Candidatus Obscuribacterales bacterium]|nr:hypothetical protein [Candidatus Obscuribacterales bacterium]
MSAADRQVDAKDAPKQGSGVVVDDDKLRNDALEALRKDSLSHAQSGGGYSYSDLFPGKPSGIPPLGPPLDWKSQFPPKTGTPDDPGGLLKHDPNIENWVSKTIREGAVIGGGVGESFFYGVANLPDHLPAIGTSIIIGGTLAAMTKTGKLGAAAAMVAGAYFTSRFVLDTIHDHRRWHKFGEAVEDGF